MLRRHGGSVGAASEATAAEMVDGAHCEKQQLSVGDAD